MGIVHVRRLLVLATVLLTYASGIVGLAQTSPEPRRVVRSKRPIVELIQPGERHIQIRRIVITEPVEIVPGKSFTEALVEFNPIIFTGRVVRKEPLFVDFRDPRVSFTIVPLAEATWIGSRITLLVERVIQTAGGFPLMNGDRIVFDVESDGSATIGGVRVEAETEMLWPIEEGKRYLVTGTVKGDGVSDARFEQSGMWLEPFDGGPLRGPSREPLAPNPSAYDTKPTFERDGAGPLDIDSVASRLEQAVSKRRSGLP